MIIIFVSRAVKPPPPLPFMEPVSFEAWNSDSQMVVAGDAHVAKVAGGHTVAGASSQKLIYRSFQMIEGVHRYAGAQGVEFTMASRGRTFGMGLVQAREDQFEYGEPQAYKYTAEGYVMYVSEDGAIRIEEKARVGRRRLHNDEKQDFRKTKRTPERKLEAEAYSHEGDAKLPIFCNFEGESTGYCEQCHDVPNCETANLNAKGLAACKAACSGYRSDLPPLAVKKHATCSYESPCAASNFKVEEYEKSEELYINAICPPTLAVRAAAMTVNTAGYRRLQYEGRGEIRGVGITSGLGDPCHFGMAFPGDVFAITVDSATLKVKYWHNDRVIYTSLMVPNFPLLIDAYMIDQGAKVDNVMWKCPVKSCPPGTSESQCEKLRAKPPSGCNFINSNFDYAAPPLKTFNPYLRPPKGSGSDGGSWWVWVIVGLIVLCCCCCGGYRVKYGAVAVPLAAAPAPPQMRAIQAPRSPPKFVAPQQPQQPIMIQPPQPQSADAGSYWDVHKNIGQ